MTRPDDQRDERLAALLAELTDARGGLVELEAQAGRHPDLADDLRALWAAVQVADEMARPDSQSHATIRWEHPSDVAPRAPAEPPGRVGGCTLLEELGRGGMGVVYRARQEALGRDVAVKRLLRAPDPATRELERFRADATIGVRLNHPNIVPIYDTGTDETGPYFIMRLIEGTTLARRLAAGPLPPREAAALLATVARAVAYAHDQGILHRDLKPSNILIDVHGHPYVCDFGLAKELDASLSLTGSGAILGTPGYMSPEQASPRRGAVGPASDVYALGAVLYHMLTGRPPFQAASAWDTLMMVLEQDPVPPRVLDPGVDPDLEMIALKCLEKRPDFRYLSATALAEDLEAYLSGEPVRARSATLRALTGRLLGETHHAAVLENWGLLWMAHSVALLAFFFLTEAIRRQGVTARWPYVLIFTGGLGAWAAVFWGLRRRGGPIRFVERQVAHIWAAGMAGIDLTFLVEWLLGLPVLTLAPLFAVHGGMLFLAKAGVLSGAFYVYALAEFLAVIPMALYPSLALPIYGVVSAWCFFATGWKYHRRRRQAREERPR